MKNSIKLFLKQCYDSYTKGEYEVIKVNKDKIEYTNKNYIFEKPKSKGITKKRCVDLSVDYLLYTFCLSKNIDIYKRYLGNVFVPKNPPFIDFSDVSFDDILLASSPETARTING